MHPQTLRMYEQKGLVRPQRTAGQHAPLLGGRPRAPAPDPAADGRARAQPRRRRGRARPRGAAAADAGADGAPRARDARSGRERAQAVPPRPRPLRPNPTTGAKVDFNKLTLKSQEAVAAAQELARRMGNPELYPEHLTLALLDQELPQQLVPDPAELRAQAEAALRTKPSSQGAQQQPQVSAAVSRVLDKALRRGEAAGGRVRLDRAPAARARRRPARAARGEDRRRARRPARHLAGSRRAPTRRSRSSAAT